MICLLLLLGIAGFAVIMAVLSFGDTEYGDSCYWCKESGINYKDSQFDCEECGGTGLIKYNYHRPLTENNVWSRWRWKMTVQW